MKSVIDMIDYHVERLRTQELVGFLRTVLCNDYNTYVNNYVRRKLDLALLNYRAEKRKSALAYADSIQPLEDGKIYTRKWERDCDCVEFTRWYVFDSKNAFFKEFRESLEWAEGSLHWHVYQNKDEWEYDKVTYHGDYDRVMTAFENGNRAPYYV